jgi:hypothetical protein
LSASNCSIHERTRRLNCGKRDSPEEAPEARSKENNTRKEKFPHDGAIPRLIATKLRMEMLEYCKITSWDVFKFEVSFKRINTASLEYSSQAIYREA